MTHDGPARTRRPSECAAAQRRAGAAPAPYGPQLPWHAPISSCAAVASVAAWRTWPSCALVARCVANLPCKPCKRRCLSARRVPGSCLLRVALGRGKRAAAARRRGTLRIWRAVCARPIGLRATTQPSRAAQWTRFLAAARTLGCLGSKAAFLVHSRPTKPSRLYVLSWLCAAHEPWHAGPPQPYDWQCAAPALPPGRPEAAAWPAPPPGGKKLSSTCAGHFAQSLRTASRKLCAVADQAAQRLRKVCSAPAQLRNRCCGRLCACALLVARAAGVHDGPQLHNLAVSYGVEAQQADALLPVEEQGKRAIRARDHARARGAPKRWPAVPCSAEPGLLPRVSGGAAGAPAGGAAGGRSARAGAVPAAHTAAERPGRT
jgi:hypothetical protein